MLTLLCRETGLDCDYVIKGETEEEILTNGAEHAMKVHGMKMEDNILMEFLQISYAKLLVSWQIKK